MKELAVNLRENLYRIYIDSGLFDNAAVLRHLRDGGPHVIITNDTIAPLYLKRVEAMLGGTARAIVIPDGEQHKTIDTYHDVMTQLLEIGAHRQSTLLALGGGVVGDIVGFVAATYRRGVPFIQIPTTLLAQVDSSVGGKTGVNHPLGKNMIGAFYQPAAVLIDIDTLATLPERHYRAGLAEVIKYGLIADEHFFNTLEESLDKLLARDATALHVAIARSCTLKADVVVRDERETLGLRMLLNFGHTFGHAIETTLGHGQWLHGEAVSYGMVLAARYSRAQNLISDGDCERIVSVLQRAGLPTTPPDNLSADAMLEAMRRDKKNIGDKQSLILLKHIGKAFVEPNSDIATIRAFLGEALATRA